MEDQDTCPFHIYPAGGGVAACPSCRTEWFVEVYFPLLRYAMDHAAGMPDLYGYYGARLFASSVSLPAMFFIPLFVLKKLFLRNFLHTAWEHVKNKT